MNERPQKRQVNRLPPERRVADIMQAAREVFTEKGYSDSLISDVAERAGVVEGTIYRFFTNKRDLLYQVAETWYVEMRAPALAGFSAVKGERNQLHFIIWHLIDSIRKAPGLWRLIYGELRPDPHFRETRFYEVQRKHTLYLTNVINSGIASGLFSADTDVVLIRDMVYGAIERHSSAFLRDKGELDTDRVAVKISEMLWRGLLAEPTPAPQQPDLLARLEAATARLEELSR